MFNKALSSAVVALAATRMVSAQTFTDCDPTEKTCPADAAFGNQKVECDFTQGACGPITEYPGTTVEYNDKGMVLSIEKESNAPTLGSHKTIFFGRIDVELQAAAGQGIVTSVVLESADLDEIDWEWVGGDDAQVQSNYFGKGDTTTYDRGAYHPVDAPLTSVHTYSVEWTSKAVQWIIDGKTVRTLTYEEAKGGSRFPQTPMEVKIGTWVAGGKNSAPGTVEWAGGYTDFSQAPFVAYYKSISIVDYAGKDAPTSDSIKEYVWTDKTGSWESIKVVKGDGSSDDSDNETKTKDEQTKTKDEQTKTKDEESSKTDEPSKTKTKVVETTTVEKTSSTASPSTFSSATSTPVSSTPGASTSSGAEETSGSETTSGAPPTVTDDGEGAAAGIMASFGRVAAAGVAAAAVAQLF